MECAAFPFFALHPDTTPHQADEPPANRKSESRATVAPRGGHIRLRKRFEYFVPLFLWYSDTRVGHREFQQPAVPGDSGDLGVNCHLSVVGKFQRVSG